MTSFKNGAHFACHLPGISVPAGLLTGVHDHSEVLSAILGINPPRYSSDTAVERSHCSMHGVINTVAKRR